MNSVYTLYTFSSVGDQYYLVHDKLSGQYSIGRVAKVNGSWCAWPTDEKPNTHPRKGFSTRREAAHALARGVESRDPSWYNAQVQAVRS